MIRIVLASFLILAALAGCGVDGAPRSPNEVEQKGKA